ncbi:hypothetical protein EBBID32_28930 [Sphingobium indicum BiD32]|uniref:Uncharacterized protein n=1 Tax=Sphingobium indicum BiD32 TaxID=1301087 RepID=N1MP64_9SPHN|nr:hypothetical protein EBBID32_28930 [Sphingobium indicum BiD32]
MGQTVLLITHDPAVGLIFVTHRSAMLRLAGQHLTLAS